MNLDAKEEPKCAKIFNGELATEFLDALQQQCGRRRQDDVIDIDDKIRQVITAFVDEQRRVQVGWDEANGSYVRTQLLKQRSRCLLESVERLDK